MPALRKENKGALFPGSSRRPVSAFVAVFGVTAVFLRMFWSSAEPGSVLPTEVCCPSPPLPRAFGGG